MQKTSKKNFFGCGNFTLFMSKSFQIWDHFFPLLFSKDSDFGKWGKKTSKRSEKHRYQKNPTQWGKITKQKNFSLRFYTLYL